MKNVLLVALALVAGVQITAARAADTQAENGAAKQQSAQAVSASQIMHGGHSILDQPAQKRWDSWDFSSGHEADGVPVPRS